MLEKVIAIIAAQLNISPSLLEETTDLVEELDADSLDIVEIVMSLEETFNIEILDEEIEGIRTPGDITAYITKQLEN